jgi:DNA-binding NtrC family response regulator
MGDDHQPASIVVIDDNPTSLEFVVESLSRSGLLVLTSTGAEEGLALVAAHHPKLVMTDVIMPGMSGIHVLRCVKAVDPTIDVVLMSVDDLPETDGNVERLAADYLRKPITPSQLRECVARLISKHQNGRPKTAS